MVERRDQVRRTFLSFVAFIASIFTIRWVSINGPFFVERAIALDAPELLFLGAADDKRVGPLVVACLVAACRLSPWGNRMTAPGGLAFAATVRVIDRVHGYATVAGTNTFPAITSSLADGYILMIGIAYLANCRHARYQYPASFTGGQLEQGVVAFLGHQLSRRSCRAHHLRALAGTELNVVHRGAGWDVLERQCIADQNVSLGPAHDRLPYLQPYRLNDVALLAVQVMHQRDARGA